MKKREDKEAPRQLIDDLAALPWTGRTVYLCYDSDLATKRDVAFAEWYLAEALTARGRLVRGGAFARRCRRCEVGLDDYLLSQPADDFRALLAAAQPPSRPRGHAPGNRAGSFGVCRRRCRH